MTPRNGKLQHVIAFRCGAEHHSALDAIARENGDSASRTARSWVLERLRSGAPGGGATEELEATLAELFTEVGELRGELTRLRTTWVEVLSLILLNVCEVSREDVARLVKKQFGEAS